MEALLILGKDHGYLRVIVELKEAPLQQRVERLLMRHKSREAFSLLRSRAEVTSYLPAGSKLAVTPRITLIEDLI